MWCDYFYIFVFIDGVHSYFYIFVFIEGAIIKKLRANVK